MSKKEQKEQVQAASQEPEKKQEQKIDQQAKKAAPATKVKKEAGPKKQVSKKEPVKKQEPKKQEPKKQEPKKQEPKKKACADDDIIVIAHLKLDIQKAIRLPKGVTIDGLLTLLNSDYNLDGSDVRILSLEDKAGDAELSYGDIIDISKHEVDGSVLDNELHALVDECCKQKKETTNESKVNGGNNCGCCCGNGRSAGSCDNSDREYDKRAAVLVSEIMKAVFSSLV